MKKLYLLIFLISSISLIAQTTVPYAQRAANYNTFFSDGGGNFDSDADKFGMWANFDAKQSVAWRSFTEDGTTTGTPSTMAIDDSFTLTVSATQAYGVIGMALLSSPTAKASWADRINNYAVQVNLNGNSGAYDPWEVVSTGGTIDASTIGGSSTTYADFKFKFTLLTATTMEVSINDGAETFTVTLNNTNITGYSIYLADDWSGVDNEDIFWKPVTEYTYAITLGTSEFTSDFEFSVFPNPVKDSFTLNTKVKELNIYDITGKVVELFREIRKGQPVDISNLNKGIYIMTVENDLGQKMSSKLVKL